MIFFGASLEVFKDDCYLKETPLINGSHVFMTGSFPQEIENLQGPQKQVNVSGYEVLSAYSDIIWCCCVVVITISLDIFSPFVPTFDWQKV